jgi:hypothetical protein
MAEVNATVLDTEPRTTLALNALMLRIQSEYREMPGLSPTRSQAQRLWGLDKSTCELVLTTLIKRGVLRRTTMGTYLRGPSSR